MDEDFLDVTTSSKKTWLIFILVVILIAVLGYFFVFKKFYFSLKTIELELGEPLSTNVEDYIKQDISNPNKYKLNIKGVTENQVGEYTYTVKYNKITKKGKVIVKDTTAPKYTLQTLKVEEGTEDYFLGDFLATCEDASEMCLVELKNSKDEAKFNKVGEHDIDIVVKDLYGNKSNAKGNLIVVAEGTFIDERTLDLEYASNSLLEEDFKGTVYMKLDKALPQNSLEKGRLSSEISVIDFEDYIARRYDGAKIQSVDIIDLYNKSKYVIGFSIRITLDNGKVVYVEEQKEEVQESTEKTETASKNTTTTSKKK